MGIETFSSLSVFISQRHNLLAIWVLKRFIFIQHYFTIKTQPTRYMGIETIIKLPFRHIILTQPTRYMGIETLLILLNYLENIDTTYSLYGY